MNIILGVTGSIAAYKTFDLIRLLIKNEHQVKVVLTKGACRFVQKELYQYLGASSVYGPDDDFSLSKNGNILHIELVKWCHKIVMAPLSANTLSDLAHGKANCLLTSLFLANTHKPVLMAPAMNTQMYQHPLTQKNIRTLTSIPYLTLIPPDEGELACGDIGLGKFPPVEEITDLIETLSPPYQQKKSILITTGASVAPLDPMRFLTNPSSGLTGYYLAKKFLSMNFPVTLLHGPHSTSYLQNLKKHPLLTLKKFDQTKEFLDHILGSIHSFSLYISSAAFCDIEFSLSQEKVKKDQFSSHIQISKAPDILSEVLKVKSLETKVVGFAAETTLNQENLQKKWQQKQVDLLIGNVVSNGMVNDNALQGFKQNHNTYFFLKDGQDFQEYNLTKKELAQKVFDWNVGRQDHADTH